MVILYASSHGSGLRSTSHIFPVNDHNDIDQNWDYISFLMFIGIKERCKSVIQPIQSIWNTYFNTNYS